MNNNEMNIIKKACEFLAKNDCEALKKIVALVKQTGIEVPFLTDENVAKLTSGLNLLNKATSALGMFGLGKGAEAVEEEKAEIKNEMQNVVNTTSNLDVSKIFNIFLENIK